MTPDDYMAAARVPETLAPQTFGLWEIRRRSVLAPIEERMVGWDRHTLLFRHTDGTIHLEFGECVMEDSLSELRQHLPIWIAGRGRVLVTGLGLGCVVRGLLAKPEVEAIDVIEIDRGILDAVGEEFAGDGRVNLIHGDALAYPVNGSRWDFAWHDIWVEPTAAHHLQVYHIELIGRFMGACGQQGAWKLPRFISRLKPEIAGLR